MEDISPILKRWPYEPGEITVRKVLGHDGRPRVQLRLDLGLLQMEMTGRPDGQRPFGAESLLDYHRERLARHRSQTGSSAGFHLTPAECSALRDECVQFYHRYLSLFHVEEFEGVVADTARNLQCLDFMRAYAAEDDDRVALEQYRPYMLMMHTRARAAVALKDEAFHEALEAVRQGIERIEAFLREIDQAEMIERSAEITSLRNLERQIRRRMPADPVEEMRKQMQAAIDVEDYELAAQLRDQLRDLEGQA